jgi:hypothetical protein
MALRLSSRLLSARWRRWTNASLFTSPRRLFDVQDEDDFKKRVLESSKPVVVDFHAEYVNVRLRDGNIMIRNTYCLFLYLQMVQPLPRAWTKA